MIFVGCGPFQWVSADAWRWFHKCRGNLLRVRPNAEIKAGSCHLFKPCRGEHIGEDKVTLLDGIVLRGK
ncbi:MAG: hypothetical protein QG577_1034 [Thermodesulfobacteriota bacterium]|nr:hypothetical protein [Thermodesulfobacteriota bacterium]